MPGGWSFNSFHRPGGRGFELPSGSRDGESAHEKNCPRGMVMVESACQFLLAQAVWVKFYSEKPSSYRVK